MACGGPVGKGGCFLTPVGVNRVEDGVDVGAAGAEPELVHFVAELGPVDAARPSVRVAPQCLVRGHHLLTIWLAGTLF